MRVVHVVAGLDPEEGAPVHTLPALWSHLVKAGIEVRPYTTVAGRAEQLVAARQGVGATLFSASRKWPGFLKRAPALAAALARELAGADLCHNHGCWLHPNWVAAGTARRLGKPLVLSPLGHLDPWSLRHHAWRKRIVRLLVEERAWRDCAAFVAKSECEADNLRKLGFKQTIRVIPNGIDPEEWRHEFSDKAFLNKYPELKGKRVMIFLSRIHPKKGLRMLLSAWLMTGNLRADWRLVVAGDDRNAHGTELRGWADQHLKPGEVVFTGALEGELKRSALSAASVLVLPSYSENFGQAVLEALAAGRPAIASRACPWPGIEQYECGWWVEAEESALRKVMGEVMSMPASELRERGERGKQWVLRDYGWATVAGRMVELYRDVLERQERT